ncbi:acyl-CoA dehydrogenase family protein [Streptosporangium roseum]|uniref:Acyl-CoA dehydrogenase domain-containing protein n=1 Tax=Streptosporangium roseum (strain ATCC 12428 / DSM 43021 / JCM 3005 / KCTC 9067 / NCIMB 10171 / NRRL 2505 / NI 9100) TaxID=479432 RepID=D2B5M6_STRRD|nr:acyl-CoA dehydrogenase family protein [Streptosporangium roseum]ACZ89531.1 acyl-CoA dehydrogenase domain-containing protein [Streptosporangium roseum DSM 43021]
MNLVLTEEQRELRGTVRSFLAAASPLPEVRRAAESESGYDPAVYRRLNGELGLAGLIVPQEYGGAGAGYAELAIVLEETGAALLPGPFLATTLAAILLTELGDKELLPAIAAGTTVATVALDGDRALNGAEADVVLMVDGTRVRAVRGGGRTPLTTLDPTRRQARVEAAGGETVASSPEGMERVRDLFAVAVAAEQLGVLRASLDAIVAYSGIRVAFGRPIGSYQGVKHKLADMHCKLEQAESIVRNAAWAADEAPGELPLAAALAQAYVGRACFEVARDSLLLHGGIGFTWEHDAHLYYKRAKSDEVLLGPPRIHRTRLADLLEL